MSSPSIKIRPVGVGPKPAIARNNVDLPEPDGPRKAKNSPASIFKFTPLSTCVSPKERFKFSITTPEDFIMSSFMYCLLQR